MREFPGIRDAPLGVLAGYRTAWNKLPWFKIKLPSLSPTSPR